MTESFDEIRPYRRDEMSPIFEKLLAEPEFISLVGKFAPQFDIEFLRRTLPGYTDLFLFHEEIIRPVAESLLGRLSSGITVSNDAADPGAPALLLSNHRDIVVDPLVVCLARLLSNQPSAQIAIGDNLLIKEWISLFVRLNGCFIVRRGLQPRDMARSFMELSSYIRHTLVGDRASIWIAQREGRAKDSDDRTQESLVKMLALSGGGDFAGNLRTLNISPICLSYEYDPCDYLKAAEFQLRRDNSDYKKTAADDLLSMQVGITGWKGRIHVAFTRSINDDLDRLAASGLSKKEQAAAVCRLCDSRIFEAYRIYPVNRWAYERLTGDTRFADADTPEERSAAEEYLHGRLAKIDIAGKDDPYLWRRLLEMYANPLINHLSTEKQHNN